MVTLGPADVFVYTDQAAHDEKKQKQKTLASRCDRERTPSERLTIDCCLEAMLKQLRHSFYGGKSYCKNGNGTICFFALLKLKVMCEHVKMLKKTALLHAVEGLSTINHHHRVIAKL